MSDFNARKSGLALLGALVLVCAGAIWAPAGAQAEETAPALDPVAEEPVQRTGTWVDISFGTGVDPETRTVIGEAAIFPPEVGRIYCWTRVHGMRPPTTVTHAWYYKGKTMARVDLAVRSENWRTWSFKTCLPEWTGNWEVKVLDQDGMVLGSGGFEVK
jgi:hypothetical protein